MSDDIYATPESNLGSGSSGGNPLADRMSRLWASMLDGLVIAAISLPVMYFTGGFEGITEGKSPSFTYNLLIGIWWLVAFLLINGKLLVNHGQTIGKKALGIKIVDMEGKLPSLKQHLIKRYAVYFLPGQIPIAGQLFSVVNILFIFGEQKRCLHDHIAGTKVVSTQTKEKQAGL